MSRTGKWAFGMLIFAIVVLAATWAFSAQHCIDVNVEENIVNVEYSSPDSLGVIAIMLDFGDCVIEKVKWEKPVPGADLDVVYISGNQLTAVCFGIFPALSSGQNVKLAEISLINTGQNKCEPDTFTNAIGSYTCMCGVDAQTIHPDINFIFTNVEDEEDGQSPVPKEFSIDTYPNPFNPSMMIKYNVPQRSKVKISVYNIRGQQVASLVDSEHTPGLYYTSWDAIGQASGTYFVKIFAPGFKGIKKVILLK
ncbi:MAG: T9SS type A sorting domain-containing protein [Candidatus Cloacimonetes bacterium]|nr:T9SS type A sorting domain-containing protein [Candidatus Cloacimonadota bacterium]